MIYLGVDFLSISGLLSNTTWTQVCPYLHRKEFEDVYGLLVAIELLLGNSNEEVLDFPMLGRLHFMHGEIEILK